MAPHEGFGGMQQRADEDDVEGHLGGKVRSEGLGGKVRSEGYGGKAPHADEDDVEGHLGGRATRGE
ncbi:MAG TPA: hypothetical protein VID25_05795 [Candidatus Limnocylindrales bacterium]